MLPGSTVDAGVLIFGFCVIVVVSAPINDICQGILDNIDIRWVDGMIMIVNRLLVDCLVFIKLIDRLRDSLQFIPCNFFLRFFFIFANNKKNVFDISQYTVKNFYECIFIRVK